MSILISALAIAAAQTPPAVQPNPHAQHQHGQHRQQVQQSQGGEKSCCCKEKMASGQKMECCAKHGERDHSGGQAAHSGHNHN